MNKTFLENKMYKKVVAMLSIIVAVFTINVLTMPASTLESDCEGECIVDKEESIEVFETESTGVSTFALNNPVKPSIDNSSKLSTITGVDTRDLIEINLYDYGTNINENYVKNKKYPGFQQNGGTKVANSTSLTDGNNFNFGDTITTDIEEIRNVTSGGTGLNDFNDDNIINRPVSGAMLSTLKDGYPALKDGTSLSYLFTQNKYASKQNEVSINRLFQHNETTGAYYYNSRDNHAQFNDDTDEFVLYNQIISSNFMMYPFGNFLPLNDIVHETTQASLFDGNRFRTIIDSAEYEATNNSNSATLKSQYSKLADTITNFDKAMTTKYRKNYTASQAATQYFTAAKLNKTISNSILKNIYSIDYDEATNFFFGLEMKMNFMQPKGGKTGLSGNENMRFYFTGDDDVWVYIDGILFLDLSGIHRHVGGEIDFVNGKVYYYELNPQTGDVSSTPYKEVSFAEILGSSANLNSKGTFKDYSTHTFNFYYMERGAGSGVMRMNFNMPVIKDNSISITKEISSNDMTALGNPDFYFQVMKPNNTSDIKDDELFIGANYQYDIYDDYGTKLRSETTDTNGVITLKAGEHVVISGIAENTGKYYVRELLDEDWVKQYKQVTVDGSTVTLDSYNSSLEVGADTFTGIVSTTKDISDGNTSFVFNNKVDVNEYAKLKIKKTMAEGTSESLLNKSFEFYVTIDDVPIAVGTEYKIGSTTYTVSKLGTINVKAGEEAVIEKILAGSKFKVEEILSATSGFTDSYKVDSVKTETDYATGTVLTSTVTVEVINTENDAIEITIPVKKETTTSDEVKYTYTFTLLDVDTDKTISEIITVNEEGIGSGEFKVEYSQAEHSEGLTTYKYKIYEEKKTTLNDVSIENDKYTSYDESIYEIEVTVNNTESGFTATYKVTKDGKSVNKDNILFNNERLSSLTLKKIVEGTGVSNKKFKFTIESTDITDGIYETSNGTIEFIEGKATTELGHNETITIYGLPYGSKYTISETNYDGFVVMYNVDSKGLVEGNKVTDVTLLNKDTEVSDDTPFGISYDTLVTFKNVKGYELPATGSSGMLVITFISTIFMGIPFMYLLKKKRGAN